MTSNTAKAKITTGSWHNALDCWGFVGLAADSCPSFDLGDGLAHDVDMGPFSRGSDCGIISELANKGTP